MDSSLVRHAKLRPRVDNHFKVLQHIGDNAYKIKLLDDYGISTTFNIYYLLPYYNEEGKQELIPNLFKQERMA